VKGTTGGKFAASVIYTSGMTPAAILPPVSRTPEANFASDTAGVVDTCGKFATGVNDVPKK
jgi:hypothetical protein